MRKVFCAMEELAIGEAPDNAKDVLSAAVTRIVVSPEMTEIHLSRRFLKAQILAEPLQENDSADQTDVFTLEISSSLAKCGGEMRLLLPPGADTGKSREVPSLSRAVARAHHWVERILRGEVRNQRDIARHTGLNERYVSRIISLAFLAPDITEAILSGTQPARMSLATFPGDVSLEWNEQRSALYGDPLL